MTEKISPQQDKWFKQFLIFKDIIVYHTKIVA